MKAAHEQDEAKRREEARRTLERLRDEPAFAGSSLAAAARRAARHFAGRDAGDEGVDSVELWGRRIGRALSLAGCVALAIYLYLTYLR
jgi:hypothetical protein